MWTYYTAIPATLGFWVGGVFSERWIETQSSFASVKPIMTNRDWLPRDMLMCIIGVFTSLAITAAILHAFGFDTVTGFGDVALANIVAIVSCGSVVVVGILLLALAMTYSP